MQHRALIVSIILTATACARAQLTTITTRQNGTIKLSGKVDDGQALVKGKTPEGSTISVNKTEIVTMETGGVCRK
jgi:hypothetical protein